MNASIHNENILIRLGIVFPALIVLFCVYCVFVLSTNKQIGTIKYEMPVSAIDTGYHPGFKAIKNW